MSLSKGKVADRLHVLAVERSIGTEDDHVGTCDGAQRPILQSRYPRNGEAIVEAQNQFHVHADLATKAAHNSHQIGILAADGHEIDKQDSAFVVLEGGLQDQRAIAVGAGAAGFAHRCNAPVSLVFVPQKGGHACGGGEGGPAEPVDRTLLADQCGSFAVADKCVVLNASSHYRHIDEKLFQQEELERDIKPGLFAARPLPPVRYGKRRLGLPHPS